MLFGNKEAVDAETFWRGREEEIGSPVLEKTLGRIVQDSNTAPLWGLVYTTAHAVYFQTFKSENWVSMLFAGGKNSRTQDKIIEISRDQIKTFAVRELKGGLFGLFRRPPQVELTWVSAETDAEETLLFEMDGKPQALVDSFNSAAN